MNTVHRWFRSGAHLVLAHIDIPKARSGSLGAVIVPPFGWEEVCSFRPLRFLAQMLAANEIPTLRFDLPGTGDSSGSAQDAGLFGAWVQSIADAASALRAETGVHEVALVGIRLGAMLALAAAAREPELRDLVLWAPNATGRALVRELRAFANVECQEYSNGDPPPQHPAPGLEAGGFLIAPETQRAIETLDFSTLPPMDGRRALILTRDDFSADAKLVRALASAGCAVEVKAGRGYEAMMTQPHETVPPAETGRTIAEFLRQDCPQGVGGVAPMGSRSTMSHIAKPVVALIDDSETRLFESVYTVERASGSMLGILSEPAPSTPRTDCAILFLNAGAVRHTGPNRMWVEAARRWAGRGAVALRLDLRGIGESDGDQNLDIASLYQDHLVEQVEIAINSLRSSTGVRRFAVVGLCSGAFWAFHTAIRNADIASAILLNPRLFFWDPEVDRRRELRRTAKGLTDWADWRRLARGEVPMERIRGVMRIALDRLGPSRSAGAQLQIQPEAMEAAWSAIERNGTRLTLIFTEGEPLLQEMEEEGCLPPDRCSRIRCIRVVNSGHTFRPLWAQKRAHELIDAELEQAMLNGAPEPLDHRILATDSPRR